MSTEVTARTGSAKIENKEDIEEQQMFYIWFTGGVCLAVAIVIAICVISAAMMSSRISKEEEESRYDAMLAFGIVSTASN